MIEVNTIQQLLSNTFNKHLWTSAVENVFNGFVQKVLFERYQNMSIWHNVLEWTRKFEQDTVWK